MQAQLHTHEFPTFVLVNQHGNTTNGLDTAKPASKGKVGVCAMQRAKISSQLFTFALFNWLNNISDQDPHRPAKVSS